MKKVFFFAPIVLALFALAPQVFAQGFTALAPITGLTDPSATSVVNSGSFASFFNNLYKYTIGLSAALAVIMIIWGGLEISTKDSVSKQSDGKERITQAIYGLILVLAPVLVFSIINPSILRLDIGIKPLNTVSGTSIPTSVTTPADAAATGLTNSTSFVSICKLPPDCEEEVTACNNMNSAAGSSSYKIGCILNGAIDPNGADITAGLFGTTILTCKVPERLGVVCTVTPIVGGA